MTNNNNPVFSVIIPVYNEEPVILETYKRLTAVMISSGERYELIFINDGSRDKSAEIIAGLCRTDTSLRLISFSRNFGHQNALTAGMDYAMGKAIVIIDADLQDPPEVILEMIGKWREGYEVVYGKRQKRIGETLLKKTTARLYYRFLRRMTSVDIPSDTGDFRLIDRKVCETMKRLNEKNRYMRGLVSWVGFKQTAVEYVRDERFAGETKYPMKKMIKLAMDGITSFSYKPLKLATTLGFLMAIGSFIYMLVIVYQKLFTNTTITGWASQTFILLFTQGIVLMVLGLSGEYIGRIYEEVKNRPIYIVSEEIGYDEESRE